MGGLSQIKQIRLAQLHKVGQSEDKLMSVKASVKCHCDIKDIL